MTLGSIEQEDAAWRPDGKMTVGLSMGNTFSFGKLLHPGKKFWGSIGFALIPSCGYLLLLSCSQWHEKKCKMSLGKSIIFKNCKF